MDYEKKYKEAVCNIQKMLEKGRKEGEVICAYEADFESIFPELKESEGEKIRKFVIKVVHEWWNRCGDPSPDFPNEEKMLAWLEKQGEQKRQMPLVKSVSTDFIDRLGTFMHYTSVDLEKEENKQLLNEAAKELLQFAYSDKANEIALASAKTWEESMAILMAANNAYRRGQKEQKPVEWGKEDEEAISMAIIALEDMYSEDEPETTYAGHGMPFDKAADRLKSLRPKKQWKPSEEQIKALSNTVDGLEKLHNISVGGYSSYTTLKSLLEQLKAL